MPTASPCFGVNSLTWMDTKRRGRNFLLLTPPSRPSHCPIQRINNLANPRRCVLWYAREKVILIAYGYNTPCVDASL